MFALHGTQMKDTLRSEDTVILIVILITFLNVFLLKSHTLLIKYVMIQDLWLIFCLFFLAKP